MKIIKYIKGVILFWCNLVKLHGFTEGCRIFSFELRYKIIVYLAKDFKNESTTGGSNLFTFFVEQMKPIDGSYPKILEIGSRVVCNQPHKSDFYYNIDYTGFDIHQGQNVDVVGDAHQLSSYFKESQFDGGFSFAVFEHLAMPWKVVLEINKILKTGGYFFLATHPTWPQHELPWDFWRFNPSSFHALFNKDTGFKVIEIIQRGKCHIVPIEYKTETRDIIREDAYMFIQVLVQKIGDYKSNHSWDTSIEIFLENTYPKR